MTLIALHGFLGKPSDWDFLQVDANLLKVSFSSATGFDTWAESFNHYIETLPAPRILMGYSLGGRLALHALLKKTNLFTSAIIISAHPGLLTDQERKKRLQDDEACALDFLSNSWDTLMQEWESKPIFQNATHRFNRKEADFDRKLLASQLQNFSLGLQSNLRPQLSQVNLPIHWIAGEKDIPYASFTKEMKKIHPLSKCYLIPGASHRAPWEQPRVFTEIIQEIISSIICVK